MKKLNAIFLTIADKVSWAMGTPMNIIFWVIAVAVWIGFGPLIAKSNFLPGWFTSNAFNFPLNTVTTLAELYIGFLIAAAANRTERKNAELSRQMKAYTGPKNLNTEGGWNKIYSRHDEKTVYSSF